MKRAFLLLICLIASAALWFVMGRQEPARARDEVESPSSTVSAFGVYAPNESTESIAGDGQQTSSLPAPQEARTVVAQRVTQGLRGTLVIPAGAPIEASLQLHVQTQSKKTPWRLINLGADGSFILRKGDFLPPTFFLRSSFLILREEFVEQAGDQFTLRPELGARIKGRLGAPWADPKRPLFRLYVGRLRGSLEDWNSRTSVPAKGKPELMQSQVISVGEFAFDVLPAGVPLVFGCSSQAGLPLQERLLLAPGETRWIDIHVIQGAEISGHVTSGEFNFDAYEYEVRLSRPLSGGQRKIIANDRIYGPEGYFHFSGLEGGHLILSANGPRYAELELELPPGSSQEGLEIELGQKMSLSGVVVWEDSQWEPASKAKTRVDLKLPNGLVRTTFIDTEQRFEFVGLVQDYTYEVRVRVPGDDLSEAMAAPWSEVRAPKRGLALNMPETAVLSGLVRGIGDLGLVWTSLVVGDQARNYWIESGNQFLIRVPAGAGLIRAESDSLALSAALPLNLSPGQRLDGLELTLGDDSTSLSGVVFDETGRLIKGALVWASDQKLPIEEPSVMGFDQRTDENGRFLIPHLLPGKLWLQAHHWDEQASHARVGVSQDGSLGKGSVFRISAPIEIELEAGERAVVRIRVQPDSVTLPSHSREN